METNFRKFTYLSFLVIAGLIALVGYLFGETILVALKIPTQLRAFGDASSLVLNHAAVAGIFSGLVGFGTFLGLSFSRSAVEYTDDCMAELSKMTWPTQKETTATTIVVCVMVLVAALLFFVMDLAWSNLFRWLL